MKSTYAERSAIRDPNWQIRNHGNGSVELGRPEGKVVTYLVDGEEEVLVCGCADDVGREEEGPREEGRVLEEVAAEDL